MDGDMVMQELIERLEKAAGPDRELDAAIEAAVRTTRESLAPWVYNNFDQWRARSDGRVEVVHADGKGGVHWVPLPYTSSLDAALTLVPGGWSISVSVSPPEHYAEQQATLQRGEPPYFQSEEIDASAETAILALCIVALRARVQPSAPGCDDRRNP